MAYVTSPEGVPGTVPDEQLQAALSKGYKLRQPSEKEQVRAEAAQHPVQAGIEAAARGATFGLSDPFLKGFGVKPEDIKARKEANPIASTVGEMAGAVGTSLVTGGGASALVGGGLKGAAFEGGLYGMGSLISESSLENKPVTVDRLAASFAGGALAGGAIHGGMTALGKGASAVMSKVGGGTLKDALNKTADDVLWKTLVPDERWRKLNEPFKADLLAFAREKGLATASAFDTAGRDRAVSLANKYAEEIGNQVKKLEGYVPLKGDHTLRTDLTGTVWAKLESEFGSNPTYTSALNEMKTKLNHIADNKSATWGDVWDFQSSLFKDVPKDAFGNPPPATAEVREAARRAIRNFVFEDVASGSNKAAKILSATEGFAPAIKTKLPSPVAEAVTVNLSEPTAAGGVFPLQGKGTTVEGFAPPLTGTQFLPPDVLPTPVGRDIPGALGRTRGLVSVEGGVSHPGGVFSFPGAAENTLSAAPTAVREGLPAPKYAPHTVVLGEDAGGKAGGLIMEGEAKQTPAWFGAQMRQTGKEARMAMSLARAFEKNTAKLENAPSTGMLSKIGAVGSLMSGNPLPLAGAVMGDVLQKQMKMRGGFLTASALRSLAESSALKGASTGLMARFQQIMSIAPEALGAYKYPLMAAAAHGADALLEEHLRLASSPYGADYMAKMGLEAETPEQVDATGRKVAILDALHAAGQSDDKEIDSLFGSAPGRKGGVSPSVSPKEFSLFQQRAAALMADPSQAFEGVPADMRAAAPSITGEAMAGSLRAIQFLQSKAPKDPYAGMPESVKPEWQPSPAELDRFSRYKEAVESPAQVLKNMANGYIAPEQVQALQAVYPALYADLQQKIGERLAMWQKPLTYQQRLAFSAILGPKALAMKPEQVQILQQATSVATTGSQGPSGGKPMKGPDGRQDVNEEQVQTEAQKLEAR